MARIAEASLEEIRQRIDIVERANWTARAPARTCAPC
jgi:hypothetical protein